MHLFIPADQVKNSEDLEIPLSKYTTELVRAYMTIYQPIVARGHDTDLLFPGVAGNSKASSGFAQRILDVILEKTGIQMNLHLFRHLGALLFLTAHPGEYETVRRFLGHKSIQTTIKFYVGLESVAAFRRYDEAVLKLRTPRDSGNRSTKR
jgi:integrase